MITDIYRKADKRSGLKTFVIPLCGKYRVSRSNGMVHSITLGNVGSFPAVKIYDSFGEIYLCPQSFMTGSFYMVAGYKDFLILEVFAGKDGLPPQLSINWRDRE